MQLKENQIDALIDIRTAYTEDAAKFEALVKIYITPEMLPAVIDYYDEESTYERWNGGDEAEQDYAEFINTLTKLVNQ